MLHRLSALLVLVATVANAGTLTTRDGRTYTGPLRLTQNKITVATATGEQTFPLDAIANADFATAANETPKPGHGLRGEYFIGRNLQRLYLVRTDPVINYTWTQTLPHPALCTWAREFSVRWTGQLQADFSETYTIIANTDDGVRVWIDDKLLIDQWWDQSASDIARTIDLEKGRKYNIKVEYYNGPSDARASLSWSSPSTPRQIIPADNLFLPPASTAAQKTAINIDTPSFDGGPSFQRMIRSDSSGLYAEYFADRELTHLVFTRFDPNVDFNYHPDNPPDPSMNPEGSIRWTGMLEPRFSEDYRFHIEVHRRARLWINDKLVINQWQGEGGPDFSSEPIPMKAGQKVSFKLEYTSPSGFMICRLRWSSRSQGRDAVPPDAFSAPPDCKIAKPVVGLVFPASDSIVAAPANIALLAAAVSPNAPIDKVEFFNGTNPFASVTGQPFRVVWNKPAPGVYKMRAKLTDTLGVTSLSDVSTLTVTGKGDGSLKAPWGDFYIANNDFRTAGMVSLDKETYKIANASGTLISDNEHDAGHFVIQPLLGDGQIIARVTSLDPKDPLANALAGVTIRENLKNRCKQYSLLFGTAANEPSTVYARRSDSWANPSITEKPGQLPIWFKLARHGQYLYAYNSADGKSWDLLASDRFESSPQVFAGLVAFSRDATKPATATFDNVQLIPGAPALESSVKGFVTRGGTFVAADVTHIDGNFVRYMRNGKEGSIATAEVSRILFKPLLADHAARLSPGTTGALMTNGDFLEGEITQLKDGHVSVSSILFGLKKVWLHEDLVAVILHDISPDKTPYVVTATDGSQYRAKSFKPEARSLDLIDASLGQVSLPLGTLATLRMQ